MLYFPISVLLQSAAYPVGALLPFIVCPNLQKPRLSVLTGVGWSPYSFEVFGNVMNSVRRVFYTR